MLKKINYYKNNLLGEIERVFFSNINHVSTPRQALEQWVKNLNSLPECKGTVLITALRNDTWVEWAVYCAAVIRQMGFESTLLYKGSEIKRLYTGPGYFNFWNGVKKIPGIKTINVEDLPYEEPVYSGYFEQFESASASSLAYNHHVESADITDAPEKFGQELQELREESAKNGARIFYYLKHNKFHQFICYSGIISDTKMLLQGAIDANQETVCVEGWAWRPGHMIYNFNAPALEYNVNGWMNYFGHRNENKNAEMEKYFKFQEGNKQEGAWLNNFYMVQLAKVSNEFPEYIKNFIQGDKKIYLLACNVIGDSSLLNRETIFKSHRDFVKQTVDYFALRPDLKLIIRAHPGEEWVKLKVKIKMGKYSLDISKGIKNILVIDSHEKLNTFSLIPFINTGLVWLSSAGVDMVVRGVPVISAALTKYYGLGIVEEPKTREEYFELIDYYSKNEIKPTKEQVDKAKEYLYLVFKGFSFEAQGRTFRASSCKLGKMPSQSEHDRFFRILMKLETPPDMIVSNEKISVH